MGKKSRREKPKNVPGHRLLSVWKGWSGAFKGKSSNFDCECGEKGRDYDHDKAAREAHTEHALSSQ